MSTGFVAIKKIPSNPLDMTLRIISLKILVFFSTKSKRVSPGLCGNPAVITTICASLQSSQLPFHTFVGDGEKGIA